VAKSQKNEKRKKNCNHISINSTSPKSGKNGKAIVMYLIKYILKIKYKYLGNNGISLFSRIVALFLVLSDRLFQRKLNIVAQHLYAE